MVFPRSARLRRPTPLNPTGRLPSENDQAELLKLKWLLIALAVFVFSSFYTYRELKYVIWGETVEASVTRTYEVTASRRRWSRKTKLAVEYTFIDNAGESVSDRDAIPRDWPPPGDTVTVQYIPGADDSSRIQGNFSSIPIWLFVGCVGWLGLGFFKLYREANETTTRG